MPNSTPATLVNTSGTGGQGIEIPAPGTLAWVRYICCTDLHRYTADTSITSFAKQFVLRAGFKYSVLLRVGNYLSRASFRFAAFLLPVYKVAFRHYQYKFGIQIPYETTIGTGLYIGHFGGIVVNDHAVIGHNCNLSHGVTIGQANRGARKGCPDIGNRVYIGPGAKIIGAVTIGSNVAIGANCVVTNDIPDNAVVVGIPGSIISFNGSADYVNNIDY